MLLFLLFFVVVCLFCFAKHIIVGRLFKKHSSIVTIFISVVCLLVWLAFVLSLALLCLLAFSLLCSHVRVKRHQRFQTARSHSAGQLLRDNNGVMECRFCGCLCLMEHLTSASFSITYRLLRALCLLALLPVVDNYVLISDRWSKSPDLYHLQCLI